MTFDLNGNHQPNRAQRRAGMHGQPPSGVPGGGVVDLGALAQKNTLEARMLRSKVVVCPLTVAIEFLVMDGSYTVKAEGLDPGAMCIGYQPVNATQIALVFYHPDWPLRAGNESPILEVKWKRYKVAELGEEIVPTPPEEPAP